MKALLIGSITKYLSDTDTHTSHTALVLKYSFGPLNSVVKNFKACCSFRIAGTNTEMRPYVTWGGSVTPLAGIISVSQSRDSRTMRMASLTFTVWLSQGSGSSATTSVFMGDAQEPSGQCFFQNTIHGWGGKVLRGFLWFNKQQLRQSIGVRDWERWVVRHSKNSSHGPLPQRVHTPPF